jgi:hypothetical protein
MVTAPASLMTWRAEERMLIFCLLRIKINLVRGEPSAVGSSQKQLPVILLLQESESLVFEDPNHYTQPEKVQRRLIIAFFSGLHQPHFFSFGVQFTAHAAPQRCEERGLRVFREA